MVGLDPTTWEPTRVKLGGRLLERQRRGIPAPLRRGRRRSYDTARDILTYAIYKEVEAGRGSPHGGVYLSFQHIDEQKLKDALGPVMEIFARNNINLTKQPVEIFPIAHYQMGGVEVDTDMASTVPGLYAAGRNRGRRQRRQPAVRQRAAGGAGVRRARRREARRNTPRETRRRGGTTRPRSRISTWCARSPDATSQRRPVAGAVDGRSENADVAQGRRVPQCAPISARRARAHPRDAAERSRRADDRAGGQLQHQRSWNGSSCATACWPPRRSRPRRSTGEESRGAHQRDDFPKADDRFLANQRLTLEAASSPRRSGRSARDRRACRDPIRRRPRGFASGAAPTATAAATRSSTSRSRTATRCWTGSSASGSMTIPSLAIRFSCFNANVCKECTMLIDGNVEYACIAKLHDRADPARSAAERPGDPRPRDRHAVAQGAVLMRGADHEACRLRLRAPGDARRCGACCSARQAGFVKVLAGGQSLGPMLNLRLAQPDLLVDITSIAELTEGHRRAQIDLEIGACVTHADIEDGRVPDHFATACCGTSPAASPIARCATAAPSAAAWRMPIRPPTGFRRCRWSVPKAVVWSPQGSRTVAVAELDVSSFTTVLQPDELIRADPGAEAVGRVRAGASTNSARRPASLPMRSAACCTIRRAACSAP